MYASAKSVERRCGEGGEVIEVVSVSEKGHGRDSHDSRILHSSSNPLIPIKWHRAGVSSYGQVTFEFGITIIASPRHELPSSL